MNLVLATSKFCGPCGMIKKYIDENSLDVKLIELGEDPDFFLRNEIKSVPTLVVIQDETICEKSVHIKTTIGGADNIMKFLKDHEKSKC